MHPHRPSTYLLILLAGLLVVGGCATRTPEDPTGSRGTFQPPTSPSIVLENLVAAVGEKNTENYMLCLADPMTRSQYPFEFEPSAEARARFQSLFDEWTTSKERQSFLSMISRLNVDQRPQLFLLNTDVNFSSPDSTVYTSDYELNVDHGITSIPTTLTGTLVFVVTPEQSGQWSISRWTDAKRSSDTVESTWSLLKAQLTN